MDTSPTDELVELHFGVQLDTGAPCPLLVQTEHITIVAFNAWQLTEGRFPQGEARWDAYCTAVAELRGCCATRFGYPNDEPRGAIPHFKGVSYGIYEVRNSSWIKEVTEMNRRTFPETEDDRTTKHFIFGFHDSTLESLAEEISLEVTKDPLDAVFDRIKRRAMEKLCLGL